MDTFYGKKWVLEISLYPVDKYKGNRLRYPLDRDLYGGEHYPPFEQMRTAPYATEPQICPTVIMTRTRMEVNTPWLRHLYFIVRQSINTLLSGILHFMSSAMKRGIERNVWLNRYIAC